MDYSPDYKLIGIRVKNMRLKHHLTQDKLAELSGIESRYLSKIENGSSKLSLPCLMSLANALNTTTDNLLMDNLIASKPNLLKEVEDVFSDCSAAEIFVFTQAVIVLKHNLRLKGLSDIQIK
jgi:transcriptional regulator with XRE-family HTH domain